MWINTWADLQGKSLSGGLNYLCGAFLLDFIQPIILIFLAHNPYLVYLRILPCVCMHLLAKGNPTKEASG